ncbi:MAG: TolC family outer membrane protein [Nitratireductor sp.]
MSKISKNMITGIFTAALLSASALPTSADSLKQALAYAYENNPTINAERANLRATDEDVTIAKSALRPQVSATGNASRTYIFDGPDTGRNTMSLGVKQTLFDGFRTKNNRNVAEFGVKAAREALNNTVQQEFANVVSAYVNVLRDSAIVSHRQRALEFLNEQVRSERTRFEVGESTRTDVAQAEGRQAAATAQVSAAKANLITSRSQYQQYVGKAPRNLKSPANIASLLPRTAKHAVAKAMKSHPSILRQLYFVDQANYSVLAANSERAPTLTLSGSLDHENTTNGGSVDSKTIGAQLNVPLYAGGANMARVRKSKEKLSQAKLNVRAVKAAVKQGVISAYAQYAAARDSVNAENKRLNAARLALQGAVEERKVGQRTTLDVLDTQQDVIDAQISLANAKRSFIAAQHSILQSIGALSIQRLSLKVAGYDPDDNYVAVKDKWFGTRTTSGQ